MTDEEKAALEAEKIDNPLKGTFFDTFEFSPKPEKTPEEIEADKKAEEDAEAKRLAEEEAAKGKTQEELDAEKAEAERLAEEEKNKPPQQTPEEIQADIEVAIKAIKEKDAKDLDDEEKQFLEDYEAGNLKDYVPPKADEAPANTKEGFDTLAKTLIDDGILVETEELEDSPEAFATVINKTVEAKVEEWLAEIPDDYKNVIDHLRAGGNVNTYLQSKQSIDYSALDYTNPAVQEALVKAELAQQGHTEEEITEKLQDFKDLDKIEKEAKRAAKLLNNQQDERLAAEDKRIADAIKAQEDAEAKEVEQLSETIDKMDDIAGFKLTDKRRDAFKKYLFDVDSDGETAASRASKDAEKRIKLYFMDFINYNFSDLQKSVETKKTRDLSNILNRFKDTQTKPKGTSVAETKPEAPEEFELKIPGMFAGNSTED